MDPISPNHPISSRDSFECSKSTRPEQISGSPGQILGNPSQLSGNPGLILGNPAQISGNPGKILVSPGQISGNPGQILCSPGQISDNPSQILDNPDQITGNPRQICAGIIALPSKVTTKDVLYLKMLLFSKLEVTTPPS